VLGLSIVIFDEPFPALLPRSARLHAAHSEQIEQ
jgi:hypothetical protein